MPAATCRVGSREDAELRNHYQSNLSWTLKTRERCSVVRLHKGKRGKPRPEVPYREVQLEMTLSQSARCRMRW